MQYDTKHFDKLLKDRANVLMMTAQVQVRTKCSNCRRGCKYCTDGYHYKWVSFIDFRYLLGHFNRRLKSIIAKHLELEDLNNIHCTYCKTLTPFKDLTVDHIIPLAKGGTHNLNNLTLSCAKCNNNKADKLVDEKLDKIEDAKISDIFPFNGPTL